MHGQTVAKEEVVNMAAMKSPVNIEEEMLMITEQIIIAQDIEIVDKYCIVREKKLY